MRLKQRLILEMNVLVGAPCAFVRVIEILQCVEVVLWAQQFLAFDSERLGNEKCLLRHLRVQRENLVELFRGEKIPEADLSSRAGHLWVIFNETLLDLGI